MIRNAGAQINMSHLNTGSKSVCSKELNAWAFTRRFTVILRRYGGRRKGDMSLECTHGPIALC